MDRENNLDPLRALAVLAVIAHHFLAHAGVRLPFLAETGGLLGVQLFFLISGYLIVQSAQRLTLRRFLIRRACRIYPAYWAATLLTTVFVSQRTPWPPAGETGPWLLHMLALSHLSPAALMRHDVLTVSWTLTVEWAWYLLVPLLAALAPRAGASRYWLGVALVLAALSSLWVALAQRGSLDFLMRAGAAGVGIDPVDPFIRFAFLANAAPAQLGFFGLGVLAWRFAPGFARLPGGLLLAGMALFLPLAVQWNGWLGLNPSLASGIGLLCLLALALRLPPLRWRWPHRLGKLSYPLYLLHVPVIIVVFHRFGVSGWTGCALALAAMLAAAQALHQTVENPGIALGRKLAS